MEKTTLCKSRLREKSTKSHSSLVEKRNHRLREEEEKANEQVLEVKLSKNALLCMSHGAFITTSLYNGDAMKADEDGEGVVLSTKPTVAGPFVMRLYDLQKKQITEDDKIEDSSERYEKRNPMMFTTSITDGTKSCPGVILEGKDGDLSKLSECIVSVSGYVMGVSSSSLESDNLSGDESKKKFAASRKETKHSPFIFITQYDMLYEKRSDGQTNDQVFSTSGTGNTTKEIGEEPTISKDLRVPKGTYQNRGRLATLISSTKLQIDDFTGINNEVTPEDDLEVANFMEQHSAIMALENRKQNASLVSSSSFSLVLGSLKYFQNYASAVKEFDEGQREEQFLSLSDMKEEFLADDFVTAEDIVYKKTTCSDDQSWIQHKETLEYALLCKDEALSSELLLRWHAWLLGDGLEQEAGSFRSEKVPKTVDHLCDTLEKQWLPKIRKDPSNPIRLASFAAAAMLGILDLVPFQVGNQRLARIVLNWTLRRAGFPFCITLYSNQLEKSEFISAIQMTRQNLCLVPQGHVEEQETASILRSTGGLGPLVGYLMHRLAEGIAKLCLLVDRKSQIAAEETDARLVRIAREKAAAEGQCIICFENKPNIATLCCGKPTHLNCLAEWLKTNSSCPQCRSEIPLLSVGQETCQRTYDRRVTYGQERISGSGFTSDEFLSSSSSDDSSSSSSSSSSSESVFYSGLGINDIQSVSSADQDGSTRSIRSLLPPLPFAVPSTPHVAVSTNRPLSNYVDVSYHVTTDEEEERDSDDESAESTYSYPTNIDDDGYFFHTNASQRSELYYDATNFEVARSDDDVNIVSDTQSQSIGNIEVDEDGYDLPSGDSSVELVRFLDPELLGSVQNDINRDPADDDVHPFNSITYSCDFPLQRRPFRFSRRSRWS